jgi:hypothetical protein
MPNEGDPSYAAWKAAIAKAIAGLSDRPILVGHSVGGTILVNALAEGALQQKARFRRRRASEEACGHLSRCNALHRSCQLVEAASGEDRDGQER